METAESLYNYWKIKISPFYRSLYGSFTTCNSFLSYTRPHIFSKESTKTGRNIIPALEVVKQLHDRKYKTASNAKRKDGNR